MSKSAQGVSATRVMSFLRRTVRAVPAVLWIVLAVRVVFYITYPPNIGGDAVGYFKMLIHGKSNLIHAPGYPFLVGLPFRTFFAATGTGWVIGVHRVAVQYTVMALQHALSLCVLLCLYHTVARIFSRRVATLAVCIAGLQPQTMGFVSCFYPEWLQGDLLVLALCASCRALTVTRPRNKVIFHSLAFAALTWCYLVKYNALFFVPIIAGLVLVDRMGWRRKAASLAIGGVIVASTLGLFIHFYHKPSTGTRALSRDHAWVLLTALGEWTPGGRIQPDAGLNSKRLIYLNRVLPWHANRVGPFWNVDFVSDEYRKPWRRKYYDILSADDATMDRLLREAPPQPDPYDFFTAFFPVTEHLGLEEGDRLGTRVFVEHVFSYPGAFAGSVTQGMLRHLCRWPTGRLYPVEVSPPEYEPYGSLGFARRHQPGTIGQNAAWYVRPVVWRPGVYLVRALELPYRVPGIVVAVAILVLLCLSVPPAFKGLEKSAPFAILVLGATLIVFYTASHLVFFRWKEAQTILPVVAVLTAVALDRVFAGVARITRRREETLPRRRPGAEEAEKRRSV
jgi:hypothetical protein